MKNLFGYYTVASYMLIIIGGFFGLIDVFAFFVSLSSPLQLLSVFIIAAVVIYSFSSFVFLNKGIKAGRQLKASFKDLIKVNAYISILYGCLVVAQTISFLSSRDQMSAMMQQVTEIQEKMKAPGVTVQAMMSTVKTVIYLMMVYGAVLLSHVFITLRLVKDNAGLFGAKQSQESKD